MSGAVEFVDRVRGALWGIFIADALSMPVHWYYDTKALKSDFGAITDYQSPKKVHPNSFMKLSNTGGQGRGATTGRIIGDVINHGKHHLWVDNAHYHAGLTAGDNTLNAICARVVMRGMTEARGYDPKKFLADYVKFMTTPGSHNDAYAESFHRAFFANWAAGVPAEKCAAGTEGHNTASIGGFVMLPPVVLGSLVTGREAAVQATVEHLGLTHESKKLAAAAKVYANLLADVAEGADLQEAVTRAGSGLGLNLRQVAAAGMSDTDAVQQTFGPACYIDSSLPAVLYLAYKHSESFEDAVLANTNAGGENCHRGAALGALMGAAVGEKGIPVRLIEGLKDKAAIRAEIDAFVSRLELGGQCGVAPQ